jgi:hypothetical protein
VAKREKSADSAPVEGSTFWLELLVYAVLIVGYLLLVLKTLDRPLARLFLEHRGQYALAALLLILLQGIVLELLTKILVGLFRRDGGPRRRKAR